MKNPHICQTCGTQVSAFAAGCSICGAPLDPRRAQRAPTMRQRTLSTWLARPRLLPRVPIPSRSR